MAQVRLLPTHNHAERKSRSRETALSKTDVMILRLLLPHERSFSSSVSSTSSLHRLYQLGTDGEDAAEQNKTDCVAHEPGVFAVQAASTLEDRVAAAEASTCAAMHNHDDGRWGAAQFTTEEFACQQVCVCVAVTAALATRAWFERLPLAHTHIHTHTHAHVHTTHRPKSHRRTLPKNWVHLQPESYGATGLVGESTYERAVFLGPEDSML